MSTGCRDLRVEHLAAPIAVGTRHPRFTWRADADAYEIEVRDARGPVWNASGTKGAAPIVYDGEPLRSTGVYSWRVRCGEGEWAASSFGVGLLDPADWAASWVEPVQTDDIAERWELLDWIRGTGPDTPPAERLRPVQLLRHEFALGGRITRARLYASARGVYEARLNGRVVGDEVLAPGFDSYAHRISVQCYDVTDLLVEDANVLGVALADGWWSGRIGLTGSSAQFGARTSAIWQLHVEYADGTSAVIGSGEGVRCTPGPWTYADLFVGERYDARLDPQGWSAPGFDDSGWDAASVIPTETGALVPFTGEPVRRVRELAPVEVRRDDEGTIVDFGQVLVGRVRLSLRSPQPGRPITIEHTEALLPDGSWFTNIDGINKEQTDVWVPRGDAVETYEPTFTFHGFRYARVRGLDGDLDPADIVAVVLGSDLPETGSFVCSDARITRLHDNVVWSQRGNFLSIPTDCPQRERAGWTGDIQVFTRAATNNAMVLPFLERWLANVRADQFDDGAVPIFSPWSPYNIEMAATGTGLSAISSAAGWSDAIAFVPWALYERYGDPRVLEENQSALDRWIEYQRRRAETELPAALEGVALDALRRADQALLFNTGEHFGDWLAPSTIEGRPIHEAIGIAPALTSEYLAPMFQAQTLTLAARIADVLGRDDADALRKRATAVRAAFAREYVDEAGDLPVRLQGVYVVALAFDMVPAQLRTKTATRLVELIHERDDRLDTGFLSVPYLLDVLWDAGHRDLARTLLWQDRLPSWLYEVDRGATTIWESWDAIAPDGTPKPTSLNHYAFGCVDDWLFTRIAGIRPDAAGYRRTVIEPDLECGLESVTAHVDTPFGRVAVAWDATALEVTVPHGVGATLRLPNGDRPLRAGRQRVMLGAA